MATMKTIATVKSYENKCATNYNITIKKNWNDAQQQAAHHARALFTVSVDDTHRTLMVQVLSAFTLPFAWSSMAHSP